MRTPFVVLAITVLLAGTGCGGPAEEEVVIEQDTVAVVDSNMEYFDTFFHEFMLRESFQKSRIEFPLTYVHWTNGEPGTSTDTVMISKNDWQHESFYLSMNIKSQLYDNFERKLQINKKRVFCWEGVETGIQVCFYFKMVDGKWYLFRKEDLST